VHLPSPQLLHVILQSIHALLAPCTRWLDGSKARSFHGLSFGASSVSSIAPCDSSKHPCAPASRPRRGVGEDWRSWKRG
jgi:hypothetical protein